MWNIIEGEADVRQYARPVDFTNIEDCMDVVTKTCDYVTFSRFGNDGSNPNKTFECTATDRWKFAAALPALVGVLDYARKLPPITGFALVENDKVVEMQTGLAVFETREKAEDIQADLTKWGKKTYAIRPVRISVQNGVEFLEN
jgi:hypothetical protein